MEDDDPPGDADAGEPCMPIELCNLSYPPKCDTYCEDEEPPPDNCTTDEAGNTTCGGEECVTMVEPDGAEVVTCPGDGCVAWHDLETGESGISCSPGTGGGDPNGGEPGVSSPGCSGDADGDGVCDDEQGDEDPGPDPCPNGPDGTMECPIPL